MWFQEGKPIHRHDDVLMAIVFVSIYVSCEEMTRFVSGFEECVLLDQVLNRACIASM